MIKVFLRFVLEGNMKEFYRASVPDRPGVHEVKLEGTGGLGSRFDGDPMFFRVREDGRAVVRDWDREGVAVVEDGDWTEVDEKGEAHFD